MFLVCSGRRRIARGCQKTPSPYRTFASRHWRSLAIRAAGAGFMRFRGPWVATPACARYAGIPESLPGSPTPSFQTSASPRIRKLP